MLRQRLIHPPLLAALAAAGHGSTILIADANYPVATGTVPTAARIHLNLSPGVLGVLQVLDVLLDAIPLEAARVMTPDGPPEPPIFEAFRERLSPLGISPSPLARHEFYSAARSPDLAVVIATGDEALFANLLLTIGVMPPADAG